MHVLSSLYLPVLASYFHSLSGEHRVAQSMYFILLSIVTYAICLPVHVYKVKLSENSSASYFEETSLT